MENLSRHTLNIISFAQYFLGVDLLKHRGQILWLENSTKLVNILRPGNQWGKTLILAIKHIYHAMTKFELEKFGINEITPMEWLKADYTTLNFGKTYEIAKGVHEAIVELVNGEYVLHNPVTHKMYLNKSRITSAIRKAYDTELPYIIWWNGSIILTRSTDDLGSSFKRRRLAFISGDEIGDIQDIISVLNATAIPRVIFYQGKIDLIGTPQDPGEYTDLIEMGKEKMEELGEKSEYYVQGGSMFENPGLSQEFVRKVESTADINLRRRIIYGGFAEIGERYFTLDEVQNMIDERFYWREKTGIIESPLSPEQAKLDRAWYVVSADFAATADRTVFGILRYDCTPVKLVYCRFFKGRDVPIPMQYQILREAYNLYAPTATRIKLIYDANALGGKNAQAQLRDLHGTPFPPEGYSPADAKAEALGSLKELMDEGRRLIETDGVIKDLEPAWGGIKVPEIRPLRLELEGYKLKDDKIKNDFIIMLAQAAFFIRRHRPKEGFIRVRSIEPATPLGLLETPPPAISPASLDQKLKGGISGIDSQRGKMPVGRIANIFA